MRLNPDGIAMSTATLPDQHPLTQTDVSEIWEKVLHDPALRDLPYKIETNRFGQIVMTPHRPIHSFYQDVLVELLKSLPEGRTAPELAVFTDEGTKVADVVWMSMERYRQAKTEIAASVAPEICVEVLSTRNMLPEIERKAALYFAKGAREVWICDHGYMRFFTSTQVAPRDTSFLAPEFPAKVILPE